MKMCKRCNNHVKKSTNIYCSNKCRANDPDNKQRTSLQMKGRTISWGHKISASLNGNKLSDAHKEQLRKSHRGMTDKIHSKLTRHKMSSIKTGTNNPMFGVELTQEHRRKIRVSTIKHIETHRGELRCNIGKHETELLDSIERSIGRKILRQYHIKPLGYIVDGYCEEINTVYEICEKYHLRSLQIEKDKNRKREIIEHLQCEFIEIIDA